MVHDVFLYLFINIFVHRDGSRGEGGPMPPTQGPPKIKNKMEKGGKKRRVKGGNGERKKY